MTTPTTHQRLDVGAYVAAVRAHLDDLEPVEVEELTEGLESDLADLAAEADDPLVHRLGPPQAYADELRASAGLRPRGPGRRSRPAVLEQLRRHPRWPAVAGFFVVLRPVWWVARAMVAFGLIGLVFGRAGIGLGGLVLLTVMVVVSVELGRGRWRRQTWLVPLVLIGNVVAALALPFAVGTVLSSLGSRASGYEPSATATVQPGLSSNGETVRNVFAYDRDGRPLTDVRLFDDQGRPLGVQSSEYVGGGVDVGAIETYVLPAQQPPMRLGEDGSDPQPAPAVPTVSVAPTLSVPPLAPTATPTPSPTPTATSTATASPKSSPARSS